MAHLIVTTPSANHWSGDLTLDANTFGGNAGLVAVMHRTGLADVTSAKVVVVIDQNAPTIVPSWNANQWWALDAGITLTATATDDRTFVTSASLILPDGGTISGTVAPGTVRFQLPATVVGSPGAAVTVPVSLAATDGAGNSALSPDASVISVDDQPPAIAPVALDPAVWRNGPLDLNANVGDGAGSGLASTSLLLNGAFTPGASDGGGGFNYHVDLSGLTATEAAVSFQIVGVDNVGNQGDAGFTLNVDNVPPVINGAQIDTAFDGTDSTSQGWFQGPTVAPGAGAVVVSAAISDANLVTSGSNRPIAIANGAPFFGTFDAGTNRWLFSIPRSVGINANAPVAVSFDAQDLAGNHPASVPSLSLQFDDVPASSFIPAIPPDTSWRPRSGTSGILVTFGSSPRSGFASVALKVAGQPDAPCTLNVDWLCSLAATDAPAGQETILPISVVAKSVTGVASSSNGTRRFDDASPVVSNANAVPYPGASTWGHDGSHYTLRDNGTIFTFTAYDCGAGVSSVASFGFSPQLATRNVSLTDSGSRVTCGNGVVAAVYNVTVTGNLSTATPGAFGGADNVGTVSVTVQDGVANQAGSSKTFNATRRLWQTSNFGAVSIALGPTLAAGTGSSVVGLRLSDGANLWTSTAPNGGSLLAGPVVGGTAGSPAVFYASSADNPAIITEVTAQNGSPLRTCSLEAALPLASSCSDPGGAITDPTLQQGHYRTAALAVAADGSLAFTQGLLKHGFNSATTNDCGVAQYWAGTMTASSCSSWFTSGANSTNGHYISQLTIGRSGRTFQLDNNFNFIATGGPTNLNEVTLGSATTTTQATCSSIVLADNGGNDSAICNPNRYTFNGAWSTTFSGGGSAFITAPAQGVYLGAAGYNLSNGGLAFGFSGSALAVDASSAVVYLNSGSSLVANAFNGGAVGAQLWALPSLSVSDSLMDKSGNLYVVSGGQVFAMATDSAGLTGGVAWPTRARDACRSSNLEYSCPW